MNGWNILRTGASARSHPKTVGAATVVVAIIACLASARADDSLGGIDSLFDKVMKAPGDAALNRRYADAATRQGDYEAAIGALERILFSDPDQAAARADLGVLYFRLGAYDLARTYLESALSAPTASDDIEQRIPAYLDEIARRQPGTSWSFSALSGLRYQSNANAGPTGQFVRANGADIALNRQFARKPDWNWYMGGTLRHTHDLENQRGDVIEAHLTGYYARQFNVQSLNAGVMDAALGPRLAIAPEALPGWSIKPYAAGTFVTLGDVPYLSAPGFGVSLMAPVETVLFELGYERRWRNFVQSAVNPGSHEQSGHSHFAFINFGARLNADMRWNIRAAIGRINARADFQSNQSRAVDFGLSWDVRVLPGMDKWTITPFAGVSLIRYDQPNASVDPATRRRDRELRGGVRVEAPVFDQVGLGAVIQYSQTTSSLPNYRMRNVSISFGPTVRF